MADEVDMAQATEAAYLAGQLEAHALAAALEAPGAERCADCGESIPAERRAAMPSAIRCVNCQAWLERIGRIQKNSNGGAP